MIPRKILLLIFSVGLLIFFIMPWFVIMPLNAFDFDNLKPGNAIAGYEVNRYEKALRSLPGLEQMKRFTASSSASPLYYAVFLIPAFAVTCIVTSLTSKSSAMIGLITGAVPLVGFSLLLIQFGARLPNHMTYGAFLTLAAGFSLIVASITKG